MKKGIVIDFIAYYEQREKQKAEQQALKSEFEIAIKQLIERMRNSG